MDITEQKRAEEELRRREADLRKVQGELAHVTRVTTMGELAASIAHEVNAAYRRRGSQRQRVSSLAGRRQG